MERAFLGETPPLTATCTAKPSAPPSLCPSDSPDLTSVPPPGDNLTHTEEKGEEKKKEVCVACVRVFATCCHTLPWELHAKRAGSWGTHPVRMLHYYLSSRGYESQGMVSGKSVSYRRRGKMDA